MSLKCSLCLSCCFTSWLNFFFCFFFCFLVNPSHLSLRSDIALHVYYCKFYLSICLTFSNTNVNLIPRLLLQVLLLFVVLHYIVNAMLHTINFTRWNTKGYLRYFLHLFGVYLCCLKNLISSRGSRSLLHDGISGLPKNL